MSELIEVKVSELSGAALDWAAGYAVRWHDRDSRDAWAHDWLRYYSPSTDWSQGGPLIEKYHVSLIYAFEEYEALIGMTHSQSSESPLVAACQAIVASVLGPVVSVPKELIHE